MIINTGQRTDIPAFYADWFANRLREGFVCVRNPFNPQQVSRYKLDPAVVDVIGFFVAGNQLFDASAHFIQIFVCDELAAVVALCGVNLE